MRLAAIRDLLNGQVLAGDEHLEAEIDTAVAADAMSAVLAAPHPRALLITGLANVQSVRTASIAYMPAILYVRDVRPNDTTIQLARAKQIVLMATPLGMFEACGLLARNGIKGAG